MLKPLLEIYSGVACRPDISNRNERLAVRMARHTALALCVNKDNLKLAAVTFGKTPKIGAVEVMPFNAQGGIPPTLAKTISTFAQQNRCKEAILGIGTAWFGAISQHRYTGSDAQRNYALLNDPISVTGIDGIPTHLQSPLLHPTEEQTLVFNIPKAPTEAFRDQLIKLGLPVVRVQSGCFSIMDLLVHHYYEQIADKDVLVIDHSGIALLITDSGKWTDIHSLPGIDALNEESVAASTKEILERRSDSQKPLIVATSFSSEMLFRIFGGALPFGCDTLPALSSQEHIDILALASDPVGAHRVGIDINPVAPDVRPHIPRYFQLLAYCATAAALFLGVVAVKEYSQNDIISQQALEFKKQIERDDVTIKDLEKDNANTRTAHSRAERVGLWVSISNNVQPLVVTALDSIPSDVPVERFAVTLAEGQPQMELTVELKAGAAAASKAIDELTLRLQSADMTLVSPKQTDIPGGVRFTGRFLLPPVTATQTTPKKTA